MVEWVPLITRVKTIALTSQTISLSPWDSIHVISHSRESVLCESIHVARAKTSQNMPHVISRLRESVLCKSIHVAGAKTSRNMPIHDEIGLLAPRLNARANRCSWESILHNINADPFHSPFHSGKNRGHVRIDPL